MIRRFKSPIRWTRLVDITTLQKSTCILIRCSICAFLALIIFACPSIAQQSRNPGGNPGLEPLDSFSTDTSDRAILFKEAWRRGQQEEGRLEPLPEGVSGEEQRRRVVAIYTEALNAMPEAPPSPDLLARIGRLWMNSSIASPQPEKASEAFHRILTDYPNNHRYVIQAIGGLADLEYKRDNHGAASRWIQKAIEYQIPDDIDGHLVSYLQQYKDDSKRMRVIYDAAAVGLHTVNETLVIKGETLDEILTHQVATIGAVEFKSTPVDTGDDLNDETMDSQLTHGSVSNTAHSNTSYTLLWLSITGGIAAAMLVIAMGLRAFRRRWKGVAMKY